MDNQICIQEAVQQALRNQPVDGWLIHDYRGSNSLGRRVLRISTDAHLTRRWFYWIPRVGEAVLVVSPLDAHELESLPGRRAFYRGWRELESVLVWVLAGARFLAMEYSQAVPALSLVDAGTVDLMRNMGMEIQSSGELLAAVMERQTKPLQESQRRAARQAVEIIDRTWQWIGDGVRVDKGPNEWEVQEFIMHQFVSRGLVTQGRPICAVNAHAANPHFAPRPGGQAMKLNDWVLIDLWCKEPSGIYADLTQVGVLASVPTAKQLATFEAVALARDAALTFLDRQIKAGQRVEGWEVDAVCRKSFEASKLLEFCLHRTGHDISDCLHGPGTNLDDFESHDTRPLRAGSCFSIEPGLYFPGDFGVRLECDVLLDAEGRLEVTGDPQQQPRCLQS